MRRLCALLVAVVLLAAVLVVAPAGHPPASAGSRYLCSSYDGCKDEGYSHFGYKKAGKKMWWRMYSGHNCTNYVAYRLVRGGMSAERPWSSSGMAYNWGRAKRGITDGKPMVGAVAWWKANVPGAGSSGHVAFVERVLSRRKIVVSEDSWSGDFHWRTITKSGSGWPTGFIHFDDRRVRALSRPTISGTPRVGGTLTATTGRWTPAASYRFQWRADGRPLTGATGQTLQVAAGLKGRQISVQVLARKRFHLEGRATSDRTARVERGRLTVVERPRIVGTPRVGQTLRLDRGSWTPAPEEVAVRWYADGRALRQAVGESELLLAKRWIGKQITVRTTARRDGYRASPVTSAPTTRVQRGRFAISSPFTATGRPALGSRLTVVPGTFTPTAGTAVTYTWLRDGRPVKDVTGRQLDLDVDDVGSRIAVRVRLRREGYEPKTLELAYADRVMTVPELRLAARGRPHKAVVNLRVLAPGVEHPSGPATVRVGGKEVRGQVKDGRLRVVVDRLDPGRYRARVAYEGTALILPGRASVRVRVPHD